MARIHRLGRPADRPFAVIFHPAAEKEFLALPQQVQGRFERALDQVAIDPFRSRPGADITKLADVGAGGALYRLRVGEYRSCYAVINAQHEIVVLLFENRGTGYERIVRTAEARRRGGNP